jgi:hypothetical protein
MGLLDWLKKPIATKVTPTPKPTPTPYIRPLPKSLEGYDVVLENKGRSEKSKTLYDYNPANRVRYTKARQAARDVGATPFENSLLTDVGASESEWGKNIQNPESSARGPMQFTNDSWNVYLIASPSARRAGHTRENLENATQGALFYMRKGQLGRWNASKDTIDKSGKKTGWGHNYTKEELAPYYKRK